MLRKSNLTYLVPGGALLLGLTSLMVGAHVQAQIAFRSKRDGNSEIYVMDADGQNPRNLTRNPAFDWYPSWSPNGGHIAFMSDRNGNWEIYVMDVNGRHPRNLTNNRAGDEFPSWSPSGRHIAFSTKRDGNWEIYVMDADGQNPQKLTNNRAWY